MKKISLMLGVLAFMLPAVASAASFVVTPSSGSYTAGDTITLNISVNPSGSIIYTALLDARFSAATFEVVSFRLNDALLPLKQSGYDALDNANGILTKTGGYTGGLTTSAPFGTVVLRAKTSGTGTFTVADSSKLLDGSNVDQQSGTQTATFAIAAKPVVAPQTTAVAPQKTATSPAKTTVASTTKTKDTTEATSTQAAAVATAGFGGSTAWVVGIIAVLIAFAAGYALGLRQGRREYE